MAGYAPGTGAYEDEGTRRHNKALTRSTNLRDLFMGLGAIAQQMGAARRAREAEADQQVEADMLGKVYSEDAGGGPQPSASNPAYEPMNYGVGGGDAGNMVEMPQEQRQAPGVREEILGARSGPASTFTNLANSFTLGSRPGRLSPQAQMRLLETQRGLSRDKSEAGYRSRQEGRADRGLDIQEGEVVARQESARADAAWKQRQDDTNRLEFMSREHLKASKIGDTVRQAAARARTGSLTTNDFIGDEMMMEAANSNPQIKAGLDKAGAAGVTPAERVRLYNKVADMLEQAAMRQDSVYEATKGSAEAYLQGVAKPAAERIFPGSTSGAAPAAAPAMDETSFESEWKRKNGIDRPLTPEEEDRLYADYIAAGGR